MFVAEKEGVLFHLKSRENKVLIAPVRGIPIADNGILYVLKPNSDKSETKEYKLNKGHLDKNVSSEQLSNVKPPIDIQSVANLDNTYYVQTKDKNMYNIENKALTKFMVEGRLIQRANGIYVFDFGSIYKVIGQSV